MPKQDNSQLPRPTPEQSVTLQRLAHRVQTGIAFFEGRRDAFGERCQETESKHLRVGVNSALIEASAMSALLFRKGIINQEEYFDTLIEFWEAEVDSYQRKVKAIDGRINI